MSSCEPDEVAPTEVVFDGIYTVQEAKTGDNYLLTVSKKTDKAGVITIENLANLVKNPIEGTVSGQRLLITEQAFTNYLGDQYTITGEGELIDKTLILRYTLKGYNGYAGSVFAKKQGDGK